MISREEIEELTQDPKLNLPPDDRSEFFAHIKRCMESIQASAKIARGGIWNNFGFQVWEEPEAEYKARMDELFYEVK